MIFKKSAAGLSDEFDPDEIELEGPEDYVVIQGHGPMNRVYFLGQDLPLALRWKTKGSILSSSNFPGLRYTALKE